MLRHRVIPIVLLDGYSVVKTIKFDVRRNLGNPIVVSRIYNTRNVDELILLDIDASKEGREIDMHTVESVAAECFMPLTVGGGLRTLKDIERTLKAGADKVSLNSALFADRSFFGKAVFNFGSQCIVVSLDVKRDSSGQYVLHSHSGRPVDLSLDQALEFCAEAQVGEVLLNNVDLDGTMEGYDTALARSVAAKVNIPLILAGGASNPADCAKALEAGASAVAAASIFHFTSITPRTCKEGMAAAGFPVRL